MGIMMLKMAAKCCFCGSIEVIEVISEMISRRKLVKCIFFRN